MLQIRLYRLKKEKKHELSFLFKNKFISLPIKSVISVKIIKVVNALEQFAPLPLQEDYDNAGLQTGLTEVDVSGALLCLDVTPAVVDEAVALGCNLIVSHHPLIFHKLQRICAEDEVQRTVMKALEKHVTIVSMHTNMDSVRGGVNFRIAGKMHLQQLQWLGKRKTVRLSTEEGQERVAEGGEGLIGSLQEPMAADDFVLMLKRTFDVECLCANELLRRPIQRVALCGGAGDFLLGEAVAAGADAFVTGEMHYHQYFGHEQQIQIAVLGHYQSEQFTMEIFRDIIQRECPDVACHITHINTNPIIYL